MLARLLFTENINPAVILHSEKRWGKNFGQKFRKIG